MLTKFTWEIKGHRDDGTYYETTIDTTLKASELSKKLESQNIIIDSLVKVKIVGVYFFNSDIKEEKKKLKFFTKQERIEYK